MQTIILAIIGSGALSTLISAIITAVSNRKGRLSKIEEKVDKISEAQKVAEKDALRTQLIMMIASYPNENTDILRLAEYYFDGLHGNWTATAIFNRWLTEYCEGVKPEGFRGEK